MLVFRQSEHTLNIYACLICPQKNRKPVILQKRHIRQHVGCIVHQSHCPSNIPWGGISYDAPFDLKSYHEHNTTTLAPHLHNNKSQIMPQHETIEWCTTATASIPFHAKQEKAIAQFHQVISVIACEGDAHVINHILFATDGTAQVSIVLYI